MDTVLTLLEKIRTLYDMPVRTELETDLAMDHTRKLYTLLLAERSQNSMLARGDEKDPLKTTDNTSLPAAPFPEQKEAQFTVAEEKPNQQPHIVSEPLSPFASFLSSDPAPLKDFRKHIGINDKYQVISELFFNDLSAFEKAVGQINKANNYAEADAWLRSNTSIPYDKTEDNDTLQLFEGLLKSFYGDN